MYVRWECPLMGNVVVREHRRETDEVSLLFRYMEEERVWLLMRRFGFSPGIRLDESISDDLLQKLNAVSYECARGVHWNSGRVRTELERYADDLMRFDRIESYTQCVTIRDLYL